MKTSLKKTILSKYNYTCQYCGKRHGDRVLNTFNRVEVSVDHIIPTSKGGSNEESNLVCCCVQCNSRKSNRDHLSSLTFRRNSRVVLRPTKDGLVLHRTRFPNNPLLLPFFN